MVFITRPDVAQGTRCDRTVFSVRTQPAAFHIFPNALWKPSCCLAGGALSAADAAEIARTVGGQLKDLRSVTHAITWSDDGQETDQGTALWRRVHRQLLSDSREQAVSVWTNLVDSANMAQGFSPKIAAFKRADRFWKACSILAREDRVPRLELLKCVFTSTEGASASELDGYVLSGIFSCSMTPAVIIYCVSVPGGRRSHFSRVTQPAPTARPMQQ